MGRRVRHVNPYHAGASMVLDARFIRTIADGATVDTWPGRTTSTYNATQTNSTYRPTYSLRGANGQASVDFTATTKAMSSATASFRTSHVLLTANKLDNLATGVADTRSFICRGSTTNAAREFYAHMYGSQYILQVSDGSSFPSANLTNSTLGWHHLSAYVETTSVGVSVDLSSYVTNTYAFTPTGSGPITIGSLLEGNTLIRSHNSHMPYVTLFPARISESLVRRFLQASGFSFKVPT